jgi:hypothetical protein
MRPRLLRQSGHSMLRSFRLVPGLCLESGLLLQPAFSQQHKRHFIAGPLAASSATTTLEKIVISEMAYRLEYDEQDLFNALF